MSPGDLVHDESSLVLGSHLVLCRIVDTEMRTPHVATGMWAAFTVAG